MTKTIDALSRGILVIDAIRTQRSISLCELHQATEIHKATLLRILKTLELSGWIYRSLADARYRLSYRVNSPAHLERSQILGEMASPYLADIQRRLGLPADLAVRSGAGMTVVESTRSTAHFHLKTARRWQTVPFLFSGIGRVYLAFCSEAECKEILVELRRQGGREGLLARDQSWLQATLRRVREQGYAEREPAFFGPCAVGNRQVEAIAVPVKQKERVVAALSVSWPQGAVEREFVNSEILPQARHAADAMAKAVAADGLFR